MYGAQQRIKEKLFHWGDKITTGNNEQKVLDYRINKRCRRDHWEHGGREGLGI